jgi:hypothetical protein
LVLFSGEKNRNNFWRKEKKEFQRKEQKEFLEKRKENQSLANSPFFIYFCALVMKALVH